MAKLTILQIGHVNWADTVTIPSHVRWHYVSPDELEATVVPRLDGLTVEPLEQEKHPLLSMQFNSILITSLVSEYLLTPLMDTVEAHAVFHDNVSGLIPMQKRGFFRRKVVKPLGKEGSYQEKVDYLILNLFSEQYGDRLEVGDIDVIPGFKGKISYNGHVHIQFEGDFGGDFAPLFTYRYNIMSLSMATEIWQEYIKEGQCDVRLEVSCLRKGSLGTVDKVIVLSEEDMQEPYVLSPDDAIGNYSVTVYAKGEGKLCFGPLHKRFSRMGLGKFILGGETKSDHLRQEFNYYFNPGDMKPPLSVYFAGFRNAEGFEGFYMMKRFKGPFMLFSDPRIDGGYFYLGTESYERQIRQAIQEALDYLGFDNTQLILSGISMGSFGALYNAAHFKPHAVVVSKPFTNIGKTVEGLKLKRPDDFETSADMIRNIIGASDKSAIEAFKQRFWTTFNKAQFTNTTFAISYMIQDDYDDTATQELIDHLAKDDVLVYTKGYEGRHNDKNEAVIKWFVTQLGKIIENDFGRADR